MNVCYFGKYSPVKWREIKLTEEMALEGSADDLKLSVKPQRDTTAGVGYISTWIQTNTLG